LYASEEGLTAIRLGADMDRRQGTQLAGDRRKTMRRERGRAMWTSTDNGTKFLQSLSDKKTHVALGANHNMDFYQGSGACRIRSGRMKDEG
jgi:hypothetical protein